MGCSGSKDADPNQGKRPSARNTRPDKKDDPASDSGEGEKRIDSIDETRTANFGGLKVRYAYLSQRGYYPEGEKSLIHSRFLVLFFVFLLFYFS